MPANVILCGVMYSGKRVEVKGRAPDSFSGLNPRLLGLIPALRGICLDNGQVLLDAIKIGPGETRTLPNLQVPLEVLETALRGITAETRIRCVFAPEGSARPKTMAELIPIMKESIEFSCQEEGDRQGVTANLLHIFPSTSELFLRFDCFKGTEGFRADFGLEITIID